jgi:preprotein translocase subunit SecG
VRLLDILDPRAIGTIAGKVTTTVQILEFVLQVLLGITSLLLTLLILLHKGRGGGLSDMFGGGMSSAMGSSGLAERNLNRFTIVLALAWFLSIVALGLITKFTVI